MQLDITLDEQISLLASVNIRIKRLKNLLDLDPELHATIKNLESIKDKLMKGGESSERDC